jgi:coenzyme F420-reducing hydrogenase delta subunit
MAEVENNNTKKGKGTGLKTDTDKNTNKESDKGFEPRIVAFLCNWCSYAGADLAGTSRVQYPPNIRVIRVMCSGRVNPLFIAKCFAEGADGVLVSGCHPGDCHYMEGNYFARRRFLFIKSLLEYLGIETGRFQMSWVSASEGGKFAEVVTKVVNDVRVLGPIKRFNFGLNLNESEITRLVVQDSGSTMKYTTIFKQHKEG